MTMNTTIGMEHFQQLYRRDEDPWLLRTRWYEQRKRALILASLPRQRYRYGYEPGCGNGELTALLALRCDRLLASDGADTAVALAEKRLQQENVDAHVMVEQHQLPDGWPQQTEGQFDLIVVSELAYYLPPESYATFVSHVMKSLAPGGTLLLCHWLPPFADRVQSTRQIHAVFDGMHTMHRLTHHEENDFLIDVWSDSDLSVAQQEGLI